MSIAVMKAVWDNSQADGTALLVLLAIADNANDEGEAWPGVASLARRARLGERQTQRLVQELASAGELEILPMVGRGHSNRYRITRALGERVTSVTPISPEKVTRRTPIRRKKGDTDDTLSSEKVTSTAEKVTSTDGKGDIAMSPEPSIEPSIEPSDSPMGRQATRFARARSAADAAAPPGNTSTQRSQSGRKGVNLAPFYLELGRRGLPRIELFGQEERLAGKLQEAHGAELLVECWTDIGAPGQPSDFADVFTQRQRTMTRLANGLFQQWLDWRSAGKPCLTKRSTNAATRRDPASGRSHEFVEYSNP